VSSVFGGLPRHVIGLGSYGRIVLCLSESTVTRNGEPAGATSDDNAEKVRQPNGFGFLECALELEAECVASGDSDLLERGSYMGIPILTPRELLEEVGEAPEE